MALESKRMIQEARDRKRKRGRGSVGEWSRKLKDHLGFWKKNKDKALIEPGVSFGDSPTTCRPHKNNVHTVWLDIKYQTHRNCLRTAE
jgi:hypothetical protein